MLHWHSGRARFLWQTGSECIGISRIVYTSKAKDTGQPESYFVHGSTYGGGGNAMQTFENVEKVLASKGCGDEKRTLEVNSNIGSCASDVRGATITGTYREVHTSNLQLRGGSYVCVFFPVSANFSKKGQGPPTHPAVLG